MFQKKICKTYIAVLICSFFSLATLSDKANALTPKQFGSALGPENIGMCLAIAQFHLKESNNVRNVLKTPNMEVVRYSKFLTEAALLQNREVINKYMSDYQLRVAKTSDENLRKNWIEKCKLRQVLTALNESEGVKNKPNQSSASRATPQPSASTPQSSNVDRDNNVSINVLFRTDGYFVIRNDISRNCNSMLSNSKGSEVFIRYSPNTMVALIRFGGKHPIRNQPGEAERIKPDDIRVPIKITDVRTVDNRYVLYKLTKFLQNGAVIIFRGQLDTSNMELIEDLIECQRCDEAQLRARSLGTKSTYSWCNLN